MAGKSERILLFTQDPRMRDETTAALDALHATERLTPVFDLDTIRRPEIDAGRHVRPAEELPAQQLDGRRAL